MEAGVLPDEIRAPVEAGVVCEQASWNEFGAVATDALPFAIRAPP